MAAAAAAAVAAGIADTAQKTDVAAQGKWGERVAFGEEPGKEEVEEGGLGGEPQKRQKPAHLLEHLRGENSCSYWHQLLMQKGQCFGE